MADGAALTRTPAEAGSNHIERLVGACGWARLPETVRERFTAARGDAEYIGVGEFHASLVGRAFALFGLALGRPLPLRTGRASVLIHVTRTAAGEVWRRAYRFGRGDEIVRSVKQAGRGDWLEERAGPLIMRLRVFEERQVLVFECLDFRLRFGRFELTLPFFATPGRIRVEHHDFGHGRFAFTLEARHPWFGLTFWQRCEMRDATPRSPPPPLPCAWLPPGAVARSSCHRP